jgi:hypothetical protein
LLILLLCTEWSNLILSVTFVKSLIGLFVRTLPGTPQVLNYLFCCFPHVR